MKQVFFNQNLILPVCWKTLKWQIQAALDWAQNVPPRTSTLEESTIDNFKKQVLKELKFKLNNEIQNQAKGYASNTSFTSGNFLVISYHLLPTVCPVRIFHFLRNCTHTWRAKGLHGATAGSRGLQACHKEFQTSWEETESTRMQKKKWLKWDLGPGTRDIQSNKQEPTW